MPAYRDAVDQRKRCDVLRQALWTERQAGFDEHWRELGEFLSPRRTRFWTGDRNKGDKRNQSIIDSTGRFAARTLSAGMHAGLTSPARPWLKLTTPDPDLAKFPPVKAWLHDVTMRMLTIFGTSNLYNVLPLTYLDLGIFGTAAQAIVQDSKDLFRCYSYPIGTYVLGQDARGLATTFIREYELTVRQVVEQFGVRPDGRSIDWSTISQPVHEAWDLGNYETAVAVTWIVKPNDNADEKRLHAKYKRWSSCYYETQAQEGNVFLRESGFDTFPIQAPRWDITGEDTYGTDCPGMTALGDVKQLQIMQRRKGQLLAKAVDPPMKGPSSLRTQKASTVPGDITYVDVREGMQGFQPVHEVRLEGFQHLTADMGEVQYRVQRAFYEDLFLMLARSDDRLGAERPTAREGEEKHEEKLLGLGPVIQRTDDELLNPIVDRVYQLMDDAGLIPPAPEALHQVRLKAEYISILAQAQKQVGVVAQDRFLSSVVGMMQADPSVAAKIDSFQAVDVYADILGVDPRIVRPTKDAQAIVDKQQKMQQNLAEGQHAVNIAKAAKDAAQAPLSGDTALTRIVSAAGQAPAAAA